METNDETKQETEAEETKAVEPAQEPTQAPTYQPAEETVGDIMKKSSGEGLKFWMIAISALVYLAGIVYAEVHGLTMLQKGVARDMRIWAQLGMIAAGMTAVVMPVTLKVWTIEAKQRLFAYFFYALDFAFLIFNAFTDFNTNTGQQLAPWAQSYVTYILPASPIIVAAMWALVWELDPSVRKKVLLLSLRAAMEEKLAHEVANAAKGANVTAVINAAAAHEVDRTLSDLFGTPAQGGYYAIDGNALPRRTAAQSFFDGLFSLARRALSSVMDTPSQPSDSSQQDEAEQ